MSNAIKDENRVAGKLGVLFSDGVTTIPIAIDSTNDAMMTNSVDVVDAAILTLYNNGKAIPRDANGVVAWSAQSSTDSSVSYPIFVDADGAVLISIT